VEDALYGHPDVADVSVIGLPDPRTGERACAVVVTEPGASVTLHALAAHCRSLGMANQKLPEQLELVEVLPRNALGKVLKQDLRRRFGG
jgi:acyl-CoA synthetase (AMP-forming)/AMP-acid ligase II